MRCPKCNGFITKIIDSRPVENTTKRKRRYECLHCEETIRFSTIEIQAEEYKTLLQKDTGKQFYKQIEELKLIIMWLLRSIFSERMNNNYLLLKKYVNNPSQEMKQRLAQFDIDLNSYQ